MNEHRKALADLFARLHGMGVESADTPGLRVCPTPGCTSCKVVMPDSDEVLMVLSEMMNVATPGVSMSDVLDAAKKAGVY